MGDFSTAKYNEWLATIGGYVSLHFDNPESAGYAESEASGGGYERDTVTWSSISSKSRWNTNAIAFSGLVAGTYNYIAGWDSPTSGTPQWYAETPGGNPFVVATGAGVLIPANQIVLSFP